MKVVWLLSDGLPGHVNQARALAQLLDLTVVEVPLRLRHKVWRPLLRAWIRCSPRVARWLGLAYEFKLPAGVPDLLLSAGGNTSFANVLLARQLLKPNLFIGSLRRLPPKNFTAVFTLEPIGAGNNIVMKVPLSPLLPSELAHEGQQLREQLGLADAPLWAMIIGGDGAGFSYTRSDWLALAAAMAALSQRYDCRWLLTTSRRSGTEAEAILQASIPKEVLADVVWYGQAPRAVMKAYLGAADRVFVTTDSMSMLADAMATGRPVYALSPEQALADARYENALNRFAADNLITRRAISGLSCSDFQVDSAPADGV
ncbi:MAG: ELM1/GtrOC1 family putative glycosyltransferase, partial [Paraperlucidibaca sp.]